MIEATTREDMDTVIHALDRSLARCASGCRNGKVDHTVAYYDIFAHPDKIFPMRWVSLISGGMTRIRRQN